MQCLLEVSQSYVELSQVHQYPKHSTALPKFHLQLKHVVSLTKSRHWCMRPGTYPTADDQPRSSNASRRRQFVEKQKAKRVGKKMGKKEAEGDAES
jgi:hypothetical protein